MNCQRADLLPVFQQLMIVALALALAYLVSMHVSRGVVVVVIIKCKREYKRCGRETNCFIRCFLFQFA